MLIQIAALGVLGFAAYKYRDTIGKNLRTATASLPLGSNAAPGNAKQAASRAASPAPRKAKAPAAKRAPARAKRTG